ncbi:MAG TPA: hypothetical protein VIH99_02925 [Bdellovibrionota bacterium]|jgi:hypothetical protein
MRKWASGLTLILCGAWGCAGSKTYGRIPASQQGYKYDAASGKCINGVGQEGRNQISKDALLTTKNGECASLLSGFTRTEVLNAYPDSKGVLDAWNFKGADFNSITFSGGPYCGIRFTNADLRGAKMDELNGVYWCIEGTIDQFTSYTLAIAPEPEIQFGCWLIEPTKLKCVN